MTGTGICTLVDMESLEIQVDVNGASINRLKLVVVCPPPEVAAGTVVVTR